MLVRAVAKKSRRLHQKSFKCLKFTSRMMKPTTLPKLWKVVTFDKCTNILSHFWEYCHIIATIIYMAILANLSCTATLLGNSAKLSRNGGITLQQMLTYAMSHFQVLQKSTRVAKSSNKWFAWKVQTKKPGYMNILMWQKVRALWKLGLRSRSSSSAPGQQHSC